MTTTTTLTPPKTPVSIGQVTIAGQTYDVKQSPEFVRFFFDLYRRVGGAEAVSNTDLALLSRSMGPMFGQEDVYQDDGMLIPGPPGLTGPPGISGPALFSIFDNSSEDPYSAALSMKV